MTSKIPDFVVYVSRPDELMDADPDTPIGNHKNVKLVMPLFDLDIPVSQRSVKVASIKTMRDLHAGIKRLLSKKLTEDAKAKIASVTNVSWLAKMFRSFDTIGANMQQQAVAGITRRGNTWTLEMSS